MHQVSRGLVLAPGAVARCWAMYDLTRSTVATVTPAPSRSRPTNFPSLTALRPKVEAAIPASAKNASISERRWLTVDMPHYHVGYVPLSMGDLPLFTCHISVKLSGS